MTYYAYVDGFSGYFLTVADLKVWAEDLNNRFQLKGKQLKIWKAVHVCRDGSGAQYSSTPAKVVVIGA